MFPDSRRSFLQRSALGVGSLAFSTLFGQSAAASPVPRAKRVIWLFMDGGISHMDTFDRKPRLDKDHGKPFPMKIEANQFDSGGPVLKSPWAFKQHGQSGMWVSELFPHLARQVDDIAFIKSMTNESAIHSSANYWMHTGWGQMGRPSAGAWINYGLGSEAQNLPGFVVLNSGLLPTGGIDNFKSGFLPARFGPTLFERKEPAVANLTPVDPQRQARQLEAINAMDRNFAARIGKHDAIETGIRNYELAAKLQSAVPDLLEISQESQAMRTAYGLDDAYEHMRGYGRQCLLARRLVERGVRFVAVTVPRVMGDTRWDAHGHLKKNHELHAKMVDRPIAALLADLKARGLWEDVLVVFATEFGRTPFSQGSDGRDHNQFGFTIWLAGGGTQGGVSCGSTDEFGYKAIENKLLVHDLHATILHLLGVDHTQLTHRFGGRDYRLTDVHGKVVKEIIA